MRNWLLILAVSITVSGCVAWERGPPSCDGGDKRAINVRKWSGTLDLACGRAE
jgi:hypothetical protein